MGDEMLTDSEVSQGVMCLCHSRLYFCQRFSCESMEMLLAMHTTERFDFIGVALLGPIKDR
jgi:hypothetical protein